MCMWHINTKHQFRWKRITILRTRDKKNMSVDFDWKNVIQGKYVLTFGIDVWYDGPGQPFSNSDKKEHQYNADTITEYAQSCI